MSPTKRLFFHDTTVLINLHRAGQIPLLGELFKDSLRWVNSVWWERVRKERDLSLDGLTKAADSVLGEPLHPQDHEHRKIRDLRRQMASPGEHPDEHLGEAETITIIHSRALNSVIVTDDVSATLFVGGTPHTTTWHLLSVAQKGGAINMQDALDVWDRFIDSGGRPPRGISSRSALESLLGYHRD